MYVKLDFKYMYKREEKAWLAVNLHEQANENAKCYGRRIQ